MQRLLKKADLILLLVLIISALFIRTIHYSESLNFSHDQALFSMKTLEIYKNKTITLIGPSISFNLEGREIFQGSVIYYFLMLFLMLGDFDPIKSSYAFTLFSVVMIIPLYFGLKLLASRNVAFAFSAIYSLLPIYVDYTKFLWNPNFQLSLFPLLILLMGLFQRYKKPWILFSLSIFSGVLTQFHYQFIIVLVILFCFYAVVQKLKFSYLLHFIFGVLVGFLPLLLFEFRNNFYNFQTLILFTSNLKSVFGSQSGIPVFATHYFLSVFLIILIITGYLTKDFWNQKKTAFVFFFLLIYSLFVYLPTPKQAFGMSKNWNYLKELKTYNIIRSNEIKNYNVINLIYNTKAFVQKYLHYKENRIYDFEDYYNNDYLYVITNREDYLNDPSYEISTFKPAELINTWEIDQVHKLHLLKRVGN